jgi:hypothetical protein
VRDYHYCLTAVAQRTEKGHDLGTRAAVESTCRLVSKQNQWGRDQSPRDRNPLLLAAGQLTGEVPAAVEHSNASERLLGSEYALSPRNATIDQGQGNVFDGVVSWQQIIGLEYESYAACAQLGPPILGQFRNVFPVQIDRAFARKIEQPDQVHQRRFSGTGRSHDGNNFFVIYAEADITDRVHCDTARAVSPAHRSEGDESLSDCHDPNLIPSNSMPADGIALPIAT